MPADPQPADPQPADPQPADPVLAQLRARIDELDAALMQLMRDRFEVTRRVGQHKKDAGLPPADPGREQVQIARLRRMAEEADLDPTFSEKLLRLIIDEVIRDYAHRGLRPDGADRP